MADQPLRNAFLCRRFTPTIETELRRRFDLAVNRDDTVLKPSDIAGKAEGAEVLFVTATETVNADVIRRLQPRLKIIATLSVGFDHIDMAAARSFGIKVLHTPDVLSDACAENVFANEPAIDSRYRMLDNVFLSPHIGSATHETRDAMGWLLIRGIETLAGGGAPANLLS